MIDFNLTMKSDTGGFRSDALAHGFGDVVRTVPSFNSAGHDLAVVRVPDAQAEAFAAMIDADENVISY